MRSYKTILKYFCKKMMQTYCPKLGHTRLPSKQECLEHLIPAIARLWEQEVGELNCAGSFYDALQGKKFYPDMLERLAVFYYLMQPGENKEELLKYYRETAKQQRRKAMPYWNRFVEEYKQEQAAKPQYFVPPKDLDAWVKTWREKDKRPIQEAIKRNLAEGKKKKQNNNETGTIKK